MRPRSPLGPITMLALAATGRIYLLRTDPYAGTAILRTLDAGYTWDRIPPPVPPEEQYVYTLAIHPNSPDTLYAGAFSGPYRSRDGGDTREEIAPSLPENPMPTDLLIRPDRPGVVRMGDGADLVVGTMAGASRWDGHRWTPLADGLITFPSGGDSVALRTTVIDVDPGSGRLYAGSAGRSGYALDLDPPAGVGGSGDAGPRRPAEAAALGQNYPNPFNPSTTIPFEVPDPSGSGGAVRGDLDIGSLRGARVRTLVRGDLAPGLHEIVWSGRDDSGRRVSSGVYLCVLKVGGTTSTRKLTILQ